jgi:hypothetical protein
LRAAGSESENEHVASVMEGVRGEQLFLARVLGSRGDYAKSKKDTASVFAGSNGNSISGGAVEAERVEFS